MILIFPSYLVLRMKYETWLYKVQNIPFFVSYMFNILCLDFYSDIKHS